MWRSFPAEGESLLASVWKVRRKILGTFITCVKQTEKGRYHHSATFTVEFFDVFVVSRLSLLHLIQALAQFTHAYSVQCFAIDDHLVRLSPLMIAREESTVRMNLLQTLSKSSDVLVEVINVKERIRRRQTLIISPRGPVNNGNEMVIERLVELLRDVISTGGGFEAEIEFELRHVLLFAGSTGAAPVHGIMIDAATVAFDEQSRFSAQLMEVVQTLLSVAVRHEPQGAVGSPSEFVVDPLVVVFIGQGLSASTEESVGGERDLAVEFVTHRPIESVGFQERIIDHGRRLIGPENPDGIGFGFRTTRNAVVIVLDIVGVKDQRVGFGSVP